MGQHAETHYELLGLASDASPDVIRRAYVEQAQASHPDHQPPGRQAEAADRMARVNEAWRVLRDPERRATYDLAIGLSPHPTSRPTESTGESGEPEDRGTRPVAGQAVGLGATVYEQSPGCGPGAWIGAGAGVVMLLLAVLVAFVVAGHDPAPSPTPVPDGFSVGDCVLVSPSASGMTATEVPCGGAAVSGRVTAVMPYPAPCPARTLEVPLVSERTTLCLAEA